MKKLLSVVVPCYNEEESLPLFYKEITRISSIVDTVDFEYIFVDDGSKDNTLSVLRDLSKKDSCVHYCSFSRNFGKESGILCGLAHSKGNYVVLMDADLQHPPKMIIDMLKAVDTEGFDSATCRRVDRDGEPLIRSFFARLFYKLINKISDADIVDGATDFRLMNREVVNAILSMKEYNRFSKGIFGWVGFDNKWIPYQNVERVAGETKWSFWKLFSYSLEGILAFSTTPLAISSLLGIVFCAFSFVYMVIILVKTLLFGEVVGGYPSMMCAILFLGGVQLLSIGVLGQYLAKTYLEVKHRPKYIIKESK